MADQSNFAELGGIKVIPKFLGRKPERPNLWSIAALLVGTVTFVGLLVSWFSPQSYNEYARPHAVATEYVTVYARPSPTQLQAPSDYAEATPTGNPSDDSVGSAVGELSTSYELESSRAVDGTDIFADYNKTPNCSLSSLDLHIPFEPLCGDKDSLMEAMSGGGRVGFDQPYKPLGCDMRWYTPDEMCTILDKFEEVIILGDSQMRGMAVAFQVLLRTDLYDGGRPSWVKGLVRPEQCHCKGVYTPGCKYYCLFSTRQTRLNDPISLYCDRRNSTSTKSGGVEYAEIGAVPVEQAAYDRVIAARAPKKPSKPYAWVFGHGLRNNLHLDMAHTWVETLMSNLATLPYYQNETAYIPRLFITPNAASVNKPVQYLDIQGNVRLQQYEHAMRKWVKGRGFDHLGTWNLTVQTTMSDGTHAGMMNDLTKAMMVFNWLDHQDTSPWGVN